MKISARDRILILAPHPDDESLATGGLLQRAVAARAAVRVLFATDGDDNPWPQRFVERKLNISQLDRQRWAGRRRAEALAALAKLHLPESAVRFLGLPDQGLTGLLLRAHEGTLRLLCREIRRWSPTLLLLPSGSDTHPDHSALFVLAQLALARLDEMPRQARYLVHFPACESEHRVTSLRLRPEEIATKRAAIACHASQMALSRKRFLAYAQMQETFYTGGGAREIENAHPIYFGHVERGAARLRIRLPKSRATFARLVLCVAFESLVAGSVRWSLTLPATSRCVRLIDAVTGEKLRAATVRIRGRMAEIALPVAALQPLRQLFVKLQRRTLFFDDAGWREIPADPEATPLLLSSALAGKVE